MTDGPLRHSRLEGHLRRVARALPNDAVSQGECIELTLDAIVRTLNIADSHALLDEIGSQARRGQLALDPMYPIELTFERHRPTPFADALRRELRFRVGCQVSVGDALEHAIAATLKDQIDKIDIRIADEFIRARDAGEISNHQCERAIKKWKSVLGLLDQSVIRDALCTSNKNPYRVRAAKKTGLDEGPML